MLLRRKLRLLSEGIWFVLVKKFLSNYVFFLGDNETESTFYSVSAFNGCKKYGTVAAASTITQEPSAKSFKLQKALIVTKLSRYEYEESRNRDLNTLQLEKKLRNRGTDYDGLLYLHNLHKKFELRVIKSFQDVGCDVKVINRWVVGIYSASNHKPFVLSHLVFCSVFYK